MGLWKIAWRSIQQRRLASALTALSMALGVTLVVAVLLIMGVIQRHYRSGTGLGYDVVIGAKGSRLQLVLNSVYYADRPIENIPYYFYQEFLPAARRGDGRDGQFRPFVAKAIPICMGDYFQGHRVVGTTPELFDDFVYDVDANRTYEFAQGRNFVTDSPEHGFFEAVVGAEVARREGVKLHDRIAPTHGVDGHVHQQFTVVGILQPSGTPVDKAVFTNIEGFYLLEGHAKESDAAAHDHEDHDHAGHDHAHDHSHEAVEPLPVAQREVTAILVLSANPLFSPQMCTVINEGPEAQAVYPVKEVAWLTQFFLTPVKRLLLLLTWLICVVAGIGILVSIYNSMAQRRMEVAVMRALGARRPTVMLIVLAESIMLSLGGGLAGWVGGHVVVGLIGRYVASLAGVGVDPLRLAPPPEFVERWLGPQRLDAAWLQALLSGEMLLIPALIFLAIVVGLLPAVAAYRTDVARTLSDAP